MSPGKCVLTSNVLLSLSSSLAFLSQKTKVLTRIRYPHKYLQYKEKCFHHLSNTFTMSKYDWPKAPAYLKYKECTLHLVH